MGLCQDICFDAAFFCNSFNDSEGYIWNRVGRKIVTERDLQEKLHQQAS